MTILYINNWELSDPLTVSTTLPNLEILSKSKLINEIIFITPEYNRDYNISTIDKVKHIAIELDSCKLPFLLKYICQELQYKKELLGLTKRYDFNRILARGAPAGGRAWWLYKKTNIPFYVESFEPHASYMKESGVWKSYDPRYLIQKYWENRILEDASGLMPVSNNYKKELIERNFLETNIYTIPCTVDTSKFLMSNKTRVKVRQKLNIPLSAMVAINVGKFGGIYYDKEAFEAFEMAFKTIDDFYLILLSPISKEELKVKLDEFPLINQERLHHAFVNQSEVTDYLSASDFAYALIKSRPSTLFCSAIKIGEYWANGLPVILSKDVGDDSKILEDSKLGALYDSKIENHLECLNGVLKTMKQENYKTNIIDLAKKYRNPKKIKDAYQQLGFIK